MSASGKDSRQLLNLVLRYFYERGGAVYLDADVINGQIKITRDEAGSAYATLLRDGHIEQVKFTDPNFPAFQVGSITGQGRIFHEQGGYRDTTTYLDRLLDRAKNKPALVWTYLIASALAILATILSVLGVFKPC